MVGALTQAALAVGRRAWQAGQDIETAVTLAGYSSAIAYSVWDYFANHATPELEAASQTQEIMAPRVKRQRTSSASKVPVAKNVKKYVKKCMDRIIDDKWNDTNCGATNPAVTGAVSASYLCTIQQGTSDVTRVGNVIRVRRLKMKGFWSAGVAEICRLVVLWDMQPNGAAPSIGDIFVTATPNVTTCFNHDTVSGYGGARFQVLFDRTSTLEPDDTTTGTTDYVTVSFDKKMNKIVRFDGNAGTVADMVTGNIVIVHFGGGTCDFTGTLTTMYQDA